MQYGDLELNADSLFMYMGTNPANENFTFVDEKSLKLSAPRRAVNQRDADLLHFWDKVRLQELCSLIISEICCLALFLRTDASNNQIAKELRNFSQYHRKNLSLLVCMSPSI